MPTGSAPALRRLRAGAHRRAAGLAATALLLAAILGACAPEPRPIMLGAEECAHCRMVIDDGRFAAQALTQSGRAYTFDAMECLAAWRSAGSVPEDEIHSMWVADFREPGSWLAAESASYVRSEGIHSPMGAGLAAHRDAASARAHQREVGGTVLDWRGVVHQLESGGGHGHDHGHPDAAAEPAANEITVTPGRPGSITAALARARPGDRIRIPAGVYREGTLVVDRPVTLEGEPGAILDGEGRHPVLLVRADSVTIRGLTLRNTPTSHVSDHAALRFEGVRACVVEGNTFENNFFGIYLARVRGCRVADNELRAHGTRESASGNGIHSWNSGDLEVTGNRVRGHRDGIYLEHTRGARLEGNLSADNLRYGLHFMFSSDTEYVDNVFHRNRAGVAVMYSERVLMADNTFEDNWGPSAYGLLLKEIRDSRITGNRLHGNTVALYSEGSGRVAVHGNSFRRNGWAVKVMANSQNNTFTENDFVDNAFDVTTNSRHNFNTFDGNHWSAYRGYDLSGDGFGDVPHRPVRLFSLLVERNPTALVLLRSVFMDLLDVAERVLPVLTPETLIDERPRMAEVWS